MNKRQRKKNRKKAIIRYVNNELMEMVKYANQLMAASALCVPSYPVGSSIFSYSTPPND